MAIKALKCKDLQGGDILLKVIESQAAGGTVRGRLIGGLIQFGQSLVGGRNPGIVHAGVLFDPYVIIETMMPKLQANDLRVQNKQYGYYVFRPKNAAFGRGAATCAKMLFDIQQRQGSMPYAWMGAALSIFGMGSGKPPSPEAMQQLLDRVLEGRDQNFFCSHLVVYIYQFVAEQSGLAPGQMFGTAAAKMPPTKLATALAGHSAFEEVGCLFPGER